MTQSVGFLVIFYQFRIADNGGKRCAEFMRDGQHDFPAGREQLFVLLHRLLQLIYQFACLFPVPANTFHVPVDDKIREQQQ